MEIKINGTVGNLSTVENLYGNLNSVGQVHTDEKAKLIQEMGTLIDCGALNSQEKSLLLESKQQVKDDEQAFLSKIKPIAGKLYDTALKVGADCLAAYLRAQFGLNG